MRLFLSVLAGALFLVLQGCGGGGGSSDNLAGTWGLKFYPEVISSTCSATRQEALRGFVNSLHPFIVERISGDDGRVRITYPNAGQVTANIVQDSGFTWSDSQFNYEPNLNSVTITYGQFFDIVDDATAVSDWTVIDDYLSQEGDCRTVIGTIVGKTS